MSIRRRANSSRSLTLDASAIAYEMLYSVFGMKVEEMEKSLDQMLREKTFVRLKQQRKQSGKQSPLRPELLSLPPIPYRVAKALDPGSYRNVQMDLWLRQASSKVPSAKAVQDKKRWLLPVARDTRDMLSRHSVPPMQGHKIKAFVPQLHGK